MALHEFKRDELEQIFTNAKNRTLGEVDVNNVFVRTVANPKITGIAGDVVEQSILGYPANSDKKPDLLVDGTPTELKTTGIRKPKKGNFIYEAKEPMSITAVSPNNITNEEFDTSSFWSKLEHMLLVYYHYDSPVTVTAADYANFFIKGYHFHEFSEEEKEILKNDWLIVRDFIQYLKDNYVDPKAEYPRISSELRKHLMLIDTAPKWPNPPRFRLKRAAVSTLVQKHFGAQFEELDETYSSFKELDAELHKLATKYRGKTIRTLIKELGIAFDFDSGKDVPKSISEQIIIKMFGGTAKKLSKIEIFSKVGLVPKTIVQTKSGTRTEDTKLFKIDFTEWTDVNISFEESFVYNYFSGQQFLCIIFEEPSSKASLLDNEFIGFKRLVFSEEILENKVNPAWQRVRDIVNNKELVETIEVDKFNKHRINKKTNTFRTSLNFPKSKDYTFFVRGSGTDSTKKIFELNGIHMYSQYFWMRGDVIIELLRNTEYI